MINAKDIGLQGHSEQFVLYFIFSYMFRLVWVVVGGKNSRENTQETKLYNKIRCITRYLNIQKVPSLLIVNTYIPF